MTYKYKRDDWVISTTNRAPLVRGQAYKVLRVIEEQGPPLLVLDGVPVPENTCFFRPAEAGEIPSSYTPSDFAKTFQLPKDDPERGSVLARLAPDTNPKTRFGMAKPPIGLIPGPAMIHMAEAFRDGAQKYGPANWREDPVSSSTYINAAFRHILSWYDGEEEAQDSGVHHLGHAAACLAILLDAQAQGTLHDDRPTKGVTASLIKERTRPIS
ncbi:hypothetical protein JIX59_03495 [Brevundimonas diminuta]|uniref:dATP/dGTP diphosphohydrolase domain-containing protein n=1 Tax=Brevundimonas diminuta TaxID=293 RepID=UPI0019040C28|nr:dATP/dGTP diphosphohydrolase domain-containing protein [Brevundimonas diminuta]MBK1968396.1 hypothetical protein [Brevundimonas diminuta]